MAESPKGISRFSTRCGGLAPILRRRLVSWRSIFSTLYGGVMTRTRGYRSLTRTRRYRSLPFFDAVKTWRRAMDALWRTMKLMLHSSFLRTRETFYVCKQESFSDTCYPASDGRMFPGGTLTFLARTLNVENYSLRPLNDVIDYLPKCRNQKGSPLHWRDEDRIGLRLARGSCTLTLVTVPGGFPRESRVIT